MFSDEKKKFREGLEELLFVSPEYGSFARAMGEPVFDSSQDTAYVTYDNTDKQIRFAFNPDFIMTLNMEETAAVILHEAHHVVLKHLEEILDNETYPQRKALMIAHECIVNDTVDSVFQLPLPDDVVRGENFVGKSCSQLPTKHVYDLLAQNEDQMKEQIEQMLQDMRDKQEKEADGSDSGQGEDSDEDHGSDAESRREEDADNTDSNGSEDSSSGDESEEGDEEGTDSAESAEEVDNGDESDQEGSSAENGSDEDKESVSKNSDSSGSEDAESSGTEESDSDDSDSGDSLSKIIGCGNFDVNNEDMKDFMDAVDSAIEDAAKEEDKSKDKFIEDLMGTSYEDHGGFSSATAKHGGDVEANLSAERMNWRHLIARINPKVLTAGRKRRKVRANWHTPNRRLRSVYPKVILPVSETVKPKKDDKGDTLPTFVIALDLSISIPHYLIGTMQGMLQDIPKDVVRAYPVTWSSELVEYDPENPRVCRTQMTRIELVEKYVKKIEEETKTKPYVLVITDGKFYGHDNWSYGKDWFYMAIDNESVKECLNHARVPENVYKVDDFIE